MDGCGRNRFSNFFGLFSTGKEKESSIVKVCSLLGLCNHHLLENWNSNLSDGTLISSSVTHPPFPIWKRDEFVFSPMRQFDKTATLKLTLCAVHVYGLPLYAEATTICGIGQRTMGIRCASDAALFRVFCDCDTSYFRDFDWLGKCQLLLGSIFEGFQCIEISKIIQATLGLTHGRTFFSF